MLPDLFVKIVGVVVRWSQRSEQRRRANQPWLDEFGRDTRKKLPFPRDYFHDNRSLREREEDAYRR